MGIVVRERWDEVIKDRGYRRREGMQWWRLFWVADAHMEGLVTFFASCILFLLLRNAW